PTNCRPVPNAPAPADDGSRVSGSLTERAARLEACLPTAPLVCAFGLLACLQMAILLPVDPAPRAIADSGTTRTFNAESLPSVVGAWRRRDFKSQDRVGKSEGRYSFSWTYDAPAAAATVSLDTPYAGWHPLEVCYRELGWTTEYFEVRRAPTPTDA